MGISGRRKCIENTAYASNASAVSLQVARFWAHCTHCQPASRTGGERAASTIQVHSLSNANPHATK
eukprot:12449793-Alexandrium_andersonii.AAC.1